MAEVDQVLTVQSPIFLALQDTGLFNNSKQLLDSPTKSSPASVFSAWNELVKAGGHNNASELLEFVDVHFAPPGSELATVNLTAYADYQPVPPFAPRLNNTLLRDFATELHGRWAHLARRVDPSKICADCESSIIPVDNDFIIPGQRFVESYYWDSYFIIRGLLVSGLHTMARNMIMNFVGSVERFGFVPPAPRKYLLCRSEPPMLSLMVRDYVQASNDTSILNRALPALETEHSFWMTNRSVATTVGTLNLYNTSCDTARPEAFQQDTQLAAQLPPSQRAGLFRNIAAAAESGWEFSSRWLTDPTDPQATLLNLTTTSIVPLDLHAVMCNAEYAIAYLYGRMADVLNQTLSAATDKAPSFMPRFDRMPPAQNDSLLQHYVSQQALYKNRSAERIQQLDAFWHEKAEFWVDLSLSAQPLANGSYSVQQRPPEARYASELSVFWAAGETNAIYVLDYYVLKRVGAWKRWGQEFETRPGGVSTSSVSSSFAWDGNNTWAPMQYMAIKSLSAIFFGSKDATAQAQLFINSVYCPWAAAKAASGEGQLYAMYNASAIGASNSPYVNEHGDAWTNGIALWVLDTYGPNLTAPRCPNAVTETQSAGNGNASASGLHYLWLILGFATVVTLAVVLVLTAWQRLRPKVMGEATAQDIGGGDLELDRLVLNDASVDPKRFPRSQVLFEQNDTVEQDDDEDIITVLGPSTRRNSRAYMPLN
ncbi:hypothetical protein RI367_004948 [Sorochytrium milnesiophthora]